MIVKCGMETDHKHIHTFYTNFLCALKKYKSGDDVNLSLHLTVLR
jgi:hypothetical protein